jgi:hypothetical protein
MHGLAEHLDSVYFGSKQGKGTEKKAKKETGFHDLAIMVVQ